MRTTTRAFKYLAASIGEGGLPQSEGSLTRTWALLSKPRKRYARYLVERYAYPVQMAIQRAYLQGFDRWPYDHRARRCVRDETDPRSFGFR